MPVLRLSLHLASLLLASALLGRSAVSTYAANATVGDGTPASCTENALRNAVSTVNDSGSGTVSFNCGTAAHTIVLTQQLRFDESGGSFTLDGGGLITLDGQDATRLIYTASGQELGLTVQNIRLINGRANGDAANERAANQGGAIYSGFRNTLTVDTVVFEDNRARAERHPYHGGGAIAIDTTSVVVIRDSEFYRNKSPNGGAINNLLSDLTIERSLFKDNESTSTDPGGGGGVYNDGGKLTISDTHFIGNKAKNLGGGIFSWANDSGNGYPGKTKLTRVVLALNEAIDPDGSGMGGGAWTGGSYVMIVKDSSVTDNVAGQRGAGLAGTGPGPNFKIINSTISGNSITGQGSGVGLFSSGGRSTVLNSTIAYNTMPGGANSQSVGAAVHTSGGFNIKNSIIAYNTGGWNDEWSCMGDVTSRGPNLQYPGNTCGGSIPVRDALLAPLTPALESLALGQTQYHPLLSFSPALNKGDKCKKTDQIGTPRPQGDACDIGAFEKTGTPPGDLSITEPTDGATLTGPVTTLSWSASTGALEYKVVVVKVRSGQKNKRILNARDLPAAFGCEDSSTCSVTLDGMNKGTFKIKVLAYNDLGKRKAKARVRVQAVALPTLESPFRR